MNIYVYKMSFLITHFLPSRHTAFYPLSKEFPKSEKHTVEPLSTMATLGTEESDHCEEVAVVERLKQE